MNNNTLYIKLVDNGDIDIELGLNNIKKLYNKETNYSNDCGFDLCCPVKLVVPARAISFKIDLMVQTRLENPEKLNIGYMLLPRSSMGAKTPLRLCNSVGIIDPQYRGNLMMFVDNVSKIDYTIEVGDRIGQIVSFAGTPINCKIVSVLDDTDRGSNGIGSTGK